MTTRHWSRWNGLLNARDIQDIEFKAKGALAGVHSKITVKKGAKIEHPVHLCFGLLHKKGNQKIKMAVRVEQDASVCFIAHCIFPKAEKVRHIMDALIDVGVRAHMSYSETHYHGLYGGIEVIPHTVARVSKNGKFFSDFTLISGRVGKLDIDYRVEADENTVAELTSKVFGHADDKSRIKEDIALSGKNARGLIKTRVALEDEALAQVTGITEGRAEGARGHVDCMEIVKDHAMAKAIPIVNVTHPLAKVTHEAAIGSVARDN